MIGKREELVLLALLRVSDEKCGAFPADVHNFLNEKLGSDDHISATYTTLVRMAAKGLLHVSKVDGRKVFTVSGSGHEALEENLEKSAALRRPLNKRAHVRNAVTEIVKAAIERSRYYGGTHMMGGEIDKAVDAILETAVRERW